MHRTTGRRSLKGLPTPYYLIDERSLLRNLKIIQRVREGSGAKCVLALKCFAAWSVFDLMRKYMDGTTSSGLYEARLGREKFGKEVHAYSVGFSRDDIAEVVRYADKIIFNSLSQLRAHRTAAGNLPVGVRVNPGFSYSHFDLADPARQYSRLGVTDRDALARASNDISGLMFHYNCENDDCANFCDNLDRIGREYGALLHDMEWVSLGGGLFFTRPDYDLKRFIAVIREFGRTFSVQVYLEPGEAAITGAAELVTTVLDVVHNEIDIAIIDASTEAHLLDHLVYGMTARIVEPKPGPFEVAIAGRSCLAGDVFGRYHLAKRLKPGSMVRIGDAAGYSMVKKNWFNGLPMPSIVVRKLDGRIDTIKSFDYADFAAQLS